MSTSGEKPHRESLEPLYTMMGGPSALRGLVLLRGSAGSGKTTLALQMIAAFLEDSLDNAAIFMSLESLPGEVTKYVNTEYSFGLGRPEGVAAIPQATLQMADIKEIGTFLPEVSRNYKLSDDYRDCREKIRDGIGRDTFDALINQHGHFMTDDGKEKLLKTLNEAITETSWLKSIATINPSDSPLVKELKTANQLSLAVRQRVSELYPDHICHAYRYITIDKDGLVQAMSTSIDPSNLQAATNFEDQIKTIFCKTLDTILGHAIKLKSRILLAIDSLNVLESLISRRLLPGTSKSEMRAVLLGISEAVKTYAKVPVTILFLGEYDENSSNASVVAESFFCDSVITLTQESVLSKEAQDRAHSARRAKRSGYDDDTGLGTPKSEETRRFCRVLKSRFGPRQARRCSYDIEPRRGIVFYETYPADGQIVLFGESEPQRAAWADFFRQDIPRLYPALEYDSFDRSALQRIFSNQRRLSYMPQRTELCLSTFDTYWVNWYYELSLRIKIDQVIHERLAQEIDLSVDTRELIKKHFQRIISATHRLFFDRLSSTNFLSKELLVADVKKVFARASEVSPALNATEKRKLTSIAAQNPALNRILIHAWKTIFQQRSRSGLLLPLNQEKLRLFGERHSNIIEELEWFIGEENRPIYKLRSDKLKGFNIDGTLASEDQRATIHKSECPEVLAVPYNANISFLVWRMDIWEKLKPKLNLTTVDGYNFCVWRIFANNTKALLGAMEPQGERGTKPLSDQEKLLSELKADDIKNWDGLKAKLPEVAKLISEATDAMLIKNRPITWEHLAALCFEDWSQWDTQKAVYQMLIETQTFDSYLSTFIELVWSCGGDLKILPDYSFKNFHLTKMKAGEALALLRFMFTKEIIPVDCSLEAMDNMNRKYGSEGRDWLAARHWYSTLIDFLSVKDDDGYLWPKKGDYKSDKPRIELVQIPVSLSYYLREKGSATHRSSWGEWYFAVMKGTENEALAVDIINNLMGSRKVCDRAFNCAAIPTVEEFYEIYGDRKCIHLPARSPDVELPKLTYKQLRSDFFATAKSRCEVFDYRHCMREFHAVLSLVNDETPAGMPKVARLLEKGMERIEGLGSKPVLTHY